MLSIIIFAMGFGQTLLLDSISPDFKVNIIEQIVQEHKKWPYQTYDRVYLVGYNYGLNVDSMKRRYGQYHASFIQDNNITLPLEQAILSKKDIQKSTALANLYGTRILSKCFLPRHALVYTNSQNEIVGFLDICFACNSIILHPSPPKNNDQIYVGYHPMKGLNHNMKRYFGYFRKLCLKKSLTYHEDEQQWAEYDAE